MAIDILMVGTQCISYANVYRVSDESGSMKTSLVSEKKQLDKGYLDPKDGSCFSGCRYPSSLTQCTCLIL